MFSHWVIYFYFPLPVISDESRAVTESMDLTAEQQENWPIFLSSCGGPNLSLSLISHPPWTPADISGHCFGGTPGSCSWGLLCLCRCRIYPWGGKGPAGARRPRSLPAIPLLPAPAQPSLTGPGRHLPPCYKGAPAHCEAVHPTLGAELKLDFRHG